MKKPELLSPAGDLKRLKVALAYGADAVYIGGEFLSLRAKAGNFTKAEMAEGIALAHSMGKRVFVAVNVSAHNHDFLELDEYLLGLQEINADALLISDPGIFMRAKKIVPKMEIHISTQANITNFAAVEFWRGMGASRVVLARELSLQEISEISKKSPGIQLETFVHGAMCMAYSGRCLISNFLHSRNANRGECSQPCRFSYTFVEEKTGEAYPATETERGTYIFNSKDLNMIAHIPELIRAGVNSFKIEGRIKTEYYVGAVTKIYREAIDDFFESSDMYEKNIPLYLDELEKVGNRGYTTGFFHGKMTGEDHDYSAANQAAAQEFLAIIENYDKETGFCTIEQRNKFTKGDAVEILRAGNKNFAQTIETILDEKGAEINSAPHPKQKLKLKINNPVNQFDIIRKTSQDFCPKISVCDYS